MALTPGTRIGPYEVTTQLGAGGMGEVYRATDSKLGREVAIKVLPAALAHDADRLARFDREARTLASLSHPNIASVYGLEDTDGSKALVMELVEGPTLADRIAVGPVPVEEALRVARQIAEALEAAHEQGIVHRDLKPANVKVRPDGTVKVLDFGLAKALEPASAQGTSAGQALSLSPTITTPAMTQAGVILGTAAYMSPEQARGGAADRRADVWAFGCVLYEMLTGRPTFDGKTTSDVLAGVLRADPDWSRLPVLHPRLRLLLERCLARDVRNRYQGIADARVDIEDALDDPRGAARGASEAPPRRSATREWAGLAAMAAIGAVLAALVMLLLSPPRTSGDDASIRFGLPPPESTMFDAGSEGIPFAVSPDGRAVAFTALTAGGRPQLWVQELDAERAQLLQGTEEAASPFWSPDSEWITFYANQSLRRIRRGGGPIETIAPTRASGAGGSAWSTNGTILFKTGRFEAGWMGVSEQGGTPFQVTTPAEGENTHIWPTFLPDGRHFVHRVYGPGGNFVHLASLEGDAPRVLMEDTGFQSSRGLAYVPGFLLFARGGALVARRFDDERLELLDEEIRLVDDVRGSAGAWDPWSVSASGVLAFWRSEWGFESVLRWYARDGGFTTAIDVPSRYSGMALAPDDRRVAFSRFVTGARNLWIRDLSTDRENQLTFDGDSFSPVWSHDGNELAISTGRSSVPDVYVTSAAGGADDSARRVTEQTLAVDIPSDWTPDGTEILYTAFGPDGSSDIRRVQLADGTDERLPVSGPFNDGSARLSPDGGWMAYATDASGGRYEVWVARYPSGDDRTQVSTGGGDQPQWSRDGRELYYVSPQLNLMVVSITLGSSIDVGQPSVLLPVPDLVPGGDWRLRYHLRRDGQRFLVEVLAPGVRQPPLQVITNWQSLLED
jgi:serine/threonine protein kinase